MSMDSVEVWLGKVAERHDEWIKYVHSMGNITHTSDLVQEMYLRLVRYQHAIRFNDDGTIPKSYIYRVLFNMVKSYKTSQSKYCFIDIDTCISLQSEQSDNVAEEAYERIMQKMFKEIDKLDQEGYPYNKELFNFYVESAMSMRGISSITNISLTSIFNTLKQCKEQLSDELREDIVDFNNGQYELIK